MKKYTSVWYAIFKKTEEVPFEVYAAESVAKDECAKMNWADGNSKEFEVKPVSIHLRYE